VTYGGVNVAMPWHGMDPAQGPTSIEGKGAHTSREGRAHKQGRESEPYVRGCAYHRCNHTASEGLCTAKVRCAYHMYIVHIAHSTHCTHCALHTAGRTLRCVRHQGDVVQHRQRRLKTLKAQRWASVCLHVCVCVCAFVCAYVCAFCVPLCVPISVPL
jgi:hypothetical protein